MAMAEKQIAQVTLGDTSATIVTAGDSERLVVKHIRVVNTSAATVSFTLYHDEDGTTYDNTTIVQPAVTLPASGVITDLSYIAISPGGSLGGVASTAAVVTLTLYGASIT